MDVTEYRLLVDTTTVAVVESLRATADLTADRLRHLTWVLALPVAGLGALVTSADDLEYPLHVVIWIDLRVVAAVLLLGSVTIGGILSSRENKALTCNRQEIALALGQKTQLLAEPIEDTNAGQLTRIIHQMEYAPGGETFAEHLRKSFLRYSKPGILLPMANVFTLVGYAILLVCALG